MVGPSPWRKLRHRAGLFLVSAGSTQSIALSCDASRMPYTDPPIRLRIHLCLRSATEKTSS
uniref:Uncharacterized protein n=1 Tax=Ralstonia solanacearum TaxID=305 RepID=A0A0S4XJL2_RALSL|nr:exported protein of unknown function [Ralstonia solanacearum]CUV40403.1 exported protein of unknown function [Ralstonia solanacearum]CUV63679.1 exported protein of unknown function [Ralstonia solanacearum]